MRLKKLMSLVLACAMALSLVTVASAADTRIYFYEDYSEYVDAEGVTALATLPPKETLLAMLLGLLKAPARNLACVLNAPISALARGLKAVAEK